jgi:hypothetical protein
LIIGHLSRAMNPYFFMTFQVQDDPKLPDDSGEVPIFKWSLGNLILAVKSSLLDGHNPAK